MNDMIAHEANRETNKKVASTGFFGMIVNKEVEEELKPRKTFIYENFKNVTTDN